MHETETIRARMAEILNLPVETLADGAVLTSLVNSSFILVELIIELQEEYGVLFGQAEMQQVSTVGELIDLFRNRMNS